MIRPVNSDDLGLLTELEAQCFDPPWSESQLRTYLNNERSSGYLIFSGSTPVGFALFTLLFDDAELLHIGICPEVRGSGRGAELLEACHKALLEKDIQRILLEVRASNNAAIGLYRRAGYQQDGVRKGYYPAAEGREDAVLMSYEFPE